jgi:excisionase family DNA binding protein
LVTFTGTGPSRPRRSPVSGRSRLTHRRWAREGAIPAAKLGNRGGFRFKREDLERFLEARRNEVTQLG